MPGPRGAGILPAACNSQVSREAKGIFQSHLPHADASERGAACSGNLNREAQTGMANGKRVPAIFKTASKK
jgi:hypothetical protein